MENHLRNKKERWLGLSPFFERQLVVPHLRQSLPGVTPAVNSSQARLRHMKLPTYRCSLPGLTGFISFHCAGPGRLHHLQKPDPKKKCLTMGLRPCYSGLQVQSTANSPSSTTKTFMDINGGERGIRTLGTVSRTHAFQACLFSLSSISPQSISLSVLSILMAERVGFEPTRQALNPPTRFRGERFQPLSHLSG